MPMAQPQRGRAIGAKGEALEHDATHAPAVSPNVGVLVLRLLQPDHRFGVAPAELTRGLGVEVNLVSLLA